MPVSWPVAALTVLGILLVILGLLVGGFELNGGQLVALGLAALVVAGYLEVARQRRQ
jgi:hypothetical protein